MSPPTERMDLIVLGGGLVGSALAHHLSRRGAGRILLYDQDHPCAGASGAGAGILSLVGCDPWEARAALESAEEYREVSERWGVGAYRENGGLAVTSTPQGKAWLERSAEHVRSTGRPAHLLTGEEVREHLPDGVFPHAGAGLLAPRDATVSSSEITFAYAELASRAGVDLRWGWGAPTVRREDGQWQMRSLGGTFEAPRLLLACGAWTPRLLEELGVPLPLQPLRAQACRLRPSPLARTFPTLHELDLDLYLRPWPGGRVLVGEGGDGRPTDPARADPGGEMAFLERVAERCAGALPRWAASHVERSWAGLCVSTPDGLPVLGRVPGAEGLFVASGFNGFGTRLAGALARRLAEAMTEGGWEALAPVDPSRFHGRIASAFHGAGPTLRLA